jgi:hypothetical protein
MPKGDSEPTTWERARNAGRALLTVMFCALRSRNSGGGSRREEGTISLPNERFEERWLDAFYKECGREVTLAYTTLNQMKNWGMIVAAAAISGLSFGTAAEKYPNVPMFVGTVVVYAFVLRFYVRAILCYINLGRWNRLQKDCVALTLSSPGSDRSPLETQLSSDIEIYYYQWRSVYSRKTQLVSNLKLGFGLLLALPLFFMVWGAVILWPSTIVQGLTVFAFLNTAVELNDFLKSGFFDDPKAHERRVATKSRRLFPGPESEGVFVGLWGSVVAGSILVVFRNAVVQRLTEWVVHCCIR